jgi:hypothetical protein
VAFEEEKNAAASRVRDSAIFPAVDFPLLLLVGGRARAPSSFNTRT